VHIYLTLIVALICWNRIYFVLIRMMKASCLIECKRKLEPKKLPGEMREIQL